MDAAGYTLSLICDCGEPTCFAEQEFSEDGPDCRAICYARAFSQGWKVGYLDEERKTFAPGHLKKEDRKYFELVRIDRISKYLKEFNRRIKEKRAAPQS